MTDEEKEDAIRAHLQDHIENLDLDGLQYLLEACACVLCDKCELIHDPDCCDLAEDDIDE